MLLGMTAFFMLLLGATGSSNVSINCTDLDTADNNSSSPPLSQIFQQCLDSYLPYYDCPDPSLCVDSGEPSPSNVGLAFGLTIGAGLATTIGALIPFIPFIRRTDTRYLAAALGLAAGVMIYVSFTEILAKSRGYICCLTATHYDLVTTACFFVGMILIVLLDLLVVGLSRIDCGFSLSSFKESCPSFRSRTTSPPDPAPQGIPLGACPSSSENHPTNQSLPNGNTAHSHRSDQGSLLETNNSDSAFDRTSVPSSNNSPTLVHNNGELSLPDNDLQTERRSISAWSNTISMTTNNIADASIQDLLSNTSIHRMHTVAETASNNMEAVSHVSISLMNENDDGFSLNPSLRTQSLPNGDVHSRVSAPSLQRRASYEEMVEQQVEQQVDGMDQFREVSDVLGANVNHLKRMGILTGLAIALHNFPEGLATFVATLSDPSFGGALAIAIALHNIPEGICVAMPVYYATGSRLKAFFWAFLSGISEPFGALLGWLILQKVFGSLVYGISFGIIAGMMIYVSLKELLPTAHKFDKSNGIIVTVFLVIGMVVMSLSLVLFSY